MKVYIYKTHIKTIVCFLDERTRSDFELVEIVEAEETNLPKTTNWKSPHTVEVGEVFACNDTFSNLIRTK